MGMPAPKMRPPADAVEAAVVQHTTPTARVIGRPFPKGVSGNPAGRKRGSKNLNGLVAQAIVEYKVGNKSFLTLMLERALESDTIMEKLMDKLLANATPEQQAGIISSFEAALQSVREGEGQQPGTTHTLAVKAQVRPAERLDTFLGEEDA